MRMSRLINFLRNYEISKNIVMIRSIMDKEEKMTKPSNHILMYQNQSFATLLLFLYCIQIVAWPTIQSNGKLRTF